MKLAREEHLVTVHQRIAPRQRGVCGDSNVQFYKDLGNTGLKSDGQFNVAWKTPGP